MRWAMTMFLTLLLTGCGLELLTTTAITSELQAKQASTAANALRYAKDSTQKQSVQSAVQAYYADKGSYPPSLDALVPGYLPETPKRADGRPFGYDPATGTVSETGPAPAPAVAPPPQAAPVPSGVPAMDQPVLTQLQQAVARYAQTTGRYPPSLQALVPTYLAMIPTTSGGQTYLYDPATGNVTHPAQPAGGPAPAPLALPPPQGATPGQAPARVGGAGGPMGEAMTGIAIQNQLNSNSNAGVTAAGSRARGGLDNAQTNHNQQQEEALREAGM